MRRRSRSSNARDASWNRRVSDAAYSDGIGGRASHRTFSSAMRSERVGARPAVRSPRTIAQAVRLLARKRPAALFFGGRSRWRSAMASRTASLAASNCCVERRVDLDVGLELGPGQAHSASAAVGLVRIGERDQRFGAMQQRRRARCDPRRSCAPPAPRGAGCAASSICAQLRRARGARPPCCAPRCAIADSAVGSSTRSSAATATSVCSDLSATLRISSGSCSRASARSRVCAVLRVAADRAERLRDRRCRSTTAARTCGCAFSRATTTTSFSRPSVDQLAHHVGGPLGVVGLGGQAGQAADGLGAHVLVGIGPRDVAEHGDVVDSASTAARRTRASASSRASATKRVAFVGPELVDGRRAHAGVGVLPAGLWAELLENTHVARDACKSQASPKSYTGDSTSMHRRLVISRVESG